jgi:sulfite exporter TauE/SafE
LNVVELLPLVSTAFLAGLLGAGHCFGMCGGIASGLGVLSARRNAIGTALVFNGARILSYVLLGGIEKAGAGLWACISPGPFVSTPLCRPTGEAHADKVGYMLVC